VTIKSDFSQSASLHRRFSDLLRVPVQSLPEDWAAKNREYPAEAGVPGPRNPHLSPSLVPFGRAAVSGRYQRVVAVTAAQMGKTDTQLDIMGQRLDERPAPILYVGPSGDFNRDIFEPRFVGMINQCESLTDKLIRGRREKKTLKYVAGVKVRFASAASSSQLKSDPAALALVDEYDEMVGNIRGQGDALGLIEARGETYADFVTVIASTPSQGVVETVECEINGLEFWAIGDVEEIASPIWRLFQEGTRHHWAWHCPHCNDPFIPMRKHLKWKTGATPAVALRSAFIECPSCGCEITEGEDSETKAAMNAGGFMIAPGQSVEDAKADQNPPDNTTYSQWASGLASPFVSWGRRAERLVKAEMSGEEDKKQTAVNANFGEVYAPGVSGDMPDWKALLKHKTHFPPGVLNPGVIRLVMGVDVQKSGIYYVVRGYGARGRSWLILNGFLIGDTEKDDVWDQLADVMQEPISGVYIEKVGIDSGFRPDKKDAGSIHRVYAFCRQYSHICVPTKGRSTTGGKPYSISEIEVKPDGKRRAYSVKLAMLCPDFFKSLVHSRIKAPSDGAGYFYLHSEADEDYARQVLSEVRIVAPGKPKPEWKPIRKDNHFLDAEAIAAAMGFILNVQTIPEGTSRSYGDDVSVIPDDEAVNDPETDDADDEPPAPAVDAVADLRKRFGRLGHRGRAR